MIKKYLLIIALVSLAGCGSFKKVPARYIAITPDNIDNLTGNYSVFSATDTDNEFPYFNNANEKFYRKYGRGVSDTIKFDTLRGGNFRISIISNKRLSVEFSRNHKKLKSQTFEYKIKKDGLLYIKNRNTIIAGVPYLFGGVDVKKVRLALSTQSDLIINDVNHSSGALLFIFGDSKTWEYNNTYKRIK